MAIPPDRPTHHEHCQEVEEFLEHPGQFLPSSKEQARDTNDGNPVDGVAGRPGPAVSKGENSGLEAPLAQAPALGERLPLGAADDRMKGRDSDEYTQMVFH